MLVEIDFVGCFESRFDREAAEGRNFSLLFRAEDVDKCWCVTVKDGVLNIFRESNGCQDLTIISSTDVFERIMKEETTGVDCYFVGDLELEGDRLRLEDLFEVFGIV